VPPDNVRYIRTVQLRISRSREFQGALCYNLPDCPMSQRSNCSPRQRSTLSSEQWWIVPWQKSEGHRTVRCHKKTKAPTVDQLQTLTVSWRGGTPDNEQWVSDGAPDCPVHPSPAALANSYKVVGGYKYPPTTTSFGIQVFLKITFNTRALAFIPRHNSKDQILSKSQIHLKHLVTCEREILCSFALLSLGLPSSFLISFLKWFVIEARDT
jgi:hypothetical protein